MSFQTSFQSITFHWFLSNQVEIKKNQTVTSVEVKKSKNINMYRFVNETYSENKYFYFIYPKEVLERVGFI